MLKGSALTGVQQDIRSRYFACERITKSAVMFSRILSKFLLVEQGKICCRIFLSQQMNYLPGSGMLRWP
jgi:hypothetical protein